jgi:hypothetical protein
MRIKAKILRMAEHKHLSLWCHIWTAKLVINYLPSVSANPNMIGM